jgi:hypothetical protein
MNRLILYNDDIHTDAELQEMVWVASGYDEVQCEQLVKLIRIRGHAIVKEGNIIEELIPMLDTMQVDGFKCKIL